MYQYQLVCVPHQQCSKRMSLGRRLYFGGRAILHCQMKLLISLDHLWFSLILTYDTLVPSVLSPRFSSPHYLEKRLETCFALDTNRCESATKSSHLALPEPVPRGDHLLCWTPVLSFLNYEAVTLEHRFDNSQHGPEGVPAVASPPWSSAPNCICSQVRFAFTNVSEKLLPAP